MNILVSACLLGLECRYDGRDNLKPEIKKLLREHCLIPVCPEVMGGLPTPRVPAERVGDRVIAQNGSDVTAAYEKGAREALKLAQLYGCQAAILKERSPSCGVGVIYDGTFSHTLTEGDGVAASCLRKNGVQVWGESRISQCMRRLENDRSER